MEIKKISLTGFMGSGKSSVSKELSLQLNLPRFDLDEFIENKNNLSIENIFKKYGEVYFREQESAYLKGILSKSQFVLSLGGGTLLDSSNLELVKNKSYLIYLKYSWHWLEKRLNSLEGRPLLQQTNVYELFELREKSYLKSHWILDCDNKSVNDICKEIICEIIKKD